MLVKAQDALKTLVSACREQRPVGAVFGAVSPPPAWTLCCQFVDRGAPGDGWQNTTQLKATGTEHELEPEPTSQLNNETLLRYQNIHIHIHMCIHIHIKT